MNIIKGKGRLFFIVQYIYDGLVVDFKCPQKIFFNYWKLYLLITIISWAEIVQQGWFGLAHFCSV